MPGITRVNLDSAGGLVTSSPQTFVRVEGELAAVAGAAIAPHGGPPHAVATLPTGSSFLSINGIPVVLAGMTATCGHVPSGSSFALVSN